MWLKNLNRDVTERTVDYKDVNQKNYLSRQVELYASAIETDLLREYFVEEDRADSTNIATTLK